MAVFILSFLVLLTIVVAMSVGVLVRGKPIKGSCGGMSALGMDTACDVCGGDQSKCDEEQERQTAASREEGSALAYDVSTDDARDSAKH